MQHRYMLTVWDLFTTKESDVCGAEAVIAITDGDQEIDRVMISGKCESLSGYSRGYTGKSGLTARMVSGPGRIGFRQVADL